MPDTKKKDALAPVRNRAKHGLYSWVSNKRLPKGQAFQFIRRELSQLADDLVRAHGGDAITPEAKILVDSIVEGLGVQKILGLYVRKFGCLDNQAAKRGRLELSPVLGRSWVSYANVVRQGILALKEVDKTRQDEGKEPMQIYAEIMKPIPVELDKKDALPGGDVPNIKQGDES